MLAISLLVIVFLLSINITCWANNFYASTGHLADGFLKEEWIPLTTQDALDYLPKETIFRYNSPLLGGCDSSRHCLATQGALLRHVSTKPNTSAMLNTITHMLARGMNTLVIVGDSVSDQFFECLTSSLQSVLGQVHENVPGNSTMQVTSIVKFLITSAQLRHFSSQNSNHKRFHVKRGHEGHRDKSADSKHYLNIIRVRPTEDTVDIHADTLDKIASGTNFTNGVHVHGPVLIISNIGLHYNSESNQEKRIYGRGVELYSKDLSVVMPRYIELAKAGHLVYFRETTAQHFGDPLGGLFTYTNGPNWHRHGTLERRAYRDPKPEYVSSYTQGVRDLFFGHKNDTSNTVVVMSSNNVPSFSLSCTPVRTEAEYLLQGWRNRMLHDIHKRFDPNNEFITIVPFYNASVSRHDAHHISFDCTHYCTHNILFWDPIWTFILNHMSSKS